MSAADGFLSRWSRRKIEAVKPAEPDGPEAPDLPPSAASEAARPLTEDEVAALPRLEDLTAGTDLAQFLRAGVPALLRKEALRRMWSLDPAIRDFVGEARDYSYDWNAVGGVPVSGPLLPTDDAGATLSRMFSRLEADEAAERVQDDGDESSPAEEAAVQDGEIVPDEAEPSPAPAALAAAAHVPALRAEDRSDAVHEPAHLGTDEARAPSPVAARARRHGRAIPKLD